MISNKDLILAYSKRCKYVMMFCNTTYVPDNGTFYEELIVFFRESTKELRLWTTYVS